MLVNKGDKLIVTKDVASFLKQGDVVEVIEVDGDMISFSFGDGMHKGLMNTAECEAHFTKYVEPEIEAPSVSEETIDWMLEHSSFTFTTVYDKCTIVTCKLPNGFVITESSACVSPENYDEDLGIEICLQRIKDKVWELEAYRLQSELYEEDCDDCDDCDMDCENCNCCEDCEELDECLDTDLDCDDCDDYDCPYNTNDKLNNEALALLADKLNKNTLNAILSIKDLDEALKNINK